MLYIGIQDLGVELNDNINEMMLFDPNEQMCKSLKRHTLILDVGV